MKFSRMLAVGAAAALVGVSTLAIGGSASAADFYVDDSQLSATETNPYSPGWFQGNVAPGGSFVSTPAGLDINGQIQILNGDPVTTSAPGTSLTAMAPGLVASGDVTFQISVFTTGDAGFTTLYADVAGIASDQWYTSQSWSTFTAHIGTNSLATYQAAMDTDSQILAFGFHVADTYSGVVQSLSWNGNTYFFTPEPVAPVTPTATVTPGSLTVAQLGTAGVTGVFTGFFPGEEVAIGLGFGEMGDDLGEAIADEDGVVTYHHVASAAAVGTYTLFAIGSQSDLQLAATFVVTANPPALAATGADFTPAIVAGGVFLLLGTGFVVAGRRRAAAHRG